ncbi:PAQR family membrane homeostasis protein TrhA [Tumebacillus amylolyticus]|uniref:PAQR family membrane homeostasis protein TrhA n=1 Tax=Tumebacillus amylolyticus TaxID=2801339 RepID=UPI00322188C6
MRWLRVKEPVNAWSHLLTCAAAVVGLIYLVVAFSEQTAGKLSSLIIYGASLIVLYLASGLYHAVRTTPSKELWLRKFDHVSIFLLIAGTYTPVFAYGLQGAWQVTMLSVVWGLAGAGMVLKLFFMNIPRWISTLIYVALGWIAVVPFFKLIQNLPAGAILFMFLGGIAYTIGAVIFGTKKLDFFPGKFGFHEVWHMFVSAGSVLHFVMIAFFVATV